MKWSSKRFMGPKSVQQRLIFLLITIFIPLSLVLFFVYRFTEQTVVNKVNEINQFRMEQTTSRIEDLFQRIFMATNLFINDRQFLGSLEVVDPYDIEKNKIYQEAIERLQYAFFLNEKYAVILRDHNDNTYVSDPSRLGLRKNQLLDEVQSIMDWKETDIFHSFKWSTLNFPQAKEETTRFIVFTRWLFNPETATKKGMISIIIPISYIQDIFKNDGGQYVLENEDHELMFSTQSYSNKTEFKRSVINDAHIVKQLNPTHWFLYQWQNTDVLNKQLELFNIVVVMTIAVVLIIYIGIIIVVLRTTRKVFYQIRSLSKQLALNSPNLQISIQSDYQLVELSEMLRQLVHNLTTSRKNFELASLEKRKLEMQMLQQQMNPHFLLNTLNTIRFIADSTLQTRLSSLVLSLSFLLRQQLYREESYWSMKEEKEYLLKYIEIQNARFGDEFKVEIWFEQEIIEKLILRMLIQPLLENCFEHAFAGRVAGLIQISAVSKANGMEINVQDNGNGIAEETMNKTLKSIGLANVKARLLLHYGEDSYFVLESDEGAGVGITIFIPDEIG